MLVVTSVRDRVAERYLGIDLQQNDKTACRDFVIGMDALLRDKSGYSVTRIDDFEVWYLGQFDEETGIFYDTENARLLMLGSQARRELEHFYELSDEESEE